MSTAQQLTFLIWTSDEVIQAVSEHLVLLTDSTFVSGGQRGQAALGDFKKCFRFQICSQRWTIDGASVHFALVSRVRGLGSVRRRFNASSTEIKWKDRTVDGPAESGTVVPVLRCPHVILSSEMSKRARVSCAESNGALALQLLVPCSIRAICRCHYGIVL